MALSYSNVDYSGLTDSSAFLLAEMRSIGSNGGTILLSPGTIKISPGVITLSNKIGISIIGSGDTATVFQLGTGAGDGIVFDHCYGCRVENVSFSSASKRASGSSLKVIGGHSSYRIDQATMAGFIGERIDFNNQATGFEISDADATTPGGAWDVTFRDCFYTDGADDADAFLINSPRGGIHVIEDVFIGMTTTPDNTHRPANGLRIRASNDFSINRFSQIYCKNGLMVDPAVGNMVRAGGFHDCYWDSNVTYGVRILASGTTADQLKFVNTWSSSNTNNLSLSGTGVDRISFIGGQCYRASGWGAIVDGAARTRISDIDFGGATSGAIWVTGSASRTKIAGNDVGPAYEFGNPAKGLVIDAGCTRTIYGGNDFSLTTTPVTDAGTSSLNNGNIVA